MKRPSRASCAEFRVLVLACAGVGLACAKATSPPAISLVQRFAEAEVAGSVEATLDFPRLEWSFDGEGTIDPAEGEPKETGGWKALHHIEGFAVRERRLLGRVTGKLPLLAVRVPPRTLPSDVLGTLEIELETSQGGRLGVLTSRSETLEVDEFLKDLGNLERADFETDLVAGELHTYRFTETDTVYPSATLLGPLRHLLLVFFGAEGADFALSRVRVVPRAEVLSGIAAGVGWQGLAGVFRETLVARVPERLSFAVELGERPWLDLAIGSPETHPTTFRVEVAAGDAEPLIFERTVTTADRWHDFPLPLDALAGRQARITLALAGEEGGRVAFWGSPTLRHRGARPAAAEPTPARAALGTAGPPSGVILIVADTLRHDHLDAWGYGRPTAPTLSKLAAEGTRFADAVSQGAWTKVAVPSILTSLYPSTHGIFDIPHRLPASVTTLAEAFRGAGYATFHAASVTFSGRNSNLQQGVEVLHERVSVTGLEGYSAKTARTYVDRLLPWLEVHRESPFFVLLHVFDPHSPFRPFDPYDRRWLDDEALAAHEEDVEKIEKVVEVFHELPTTQELAVAGVAKERYLEAATAWYDASIRAMDAEIARLVERLEELRLADSTLLAFVGDHGEEFLEHGRSWHGQSIYGDMINVPMLVRWPGVVPAGLVVEATTQQIDLMPTLLELALLPVPEGAQGRSLLPLLAAPDDPASLGWRRAPVFAERKEPPGEPIEKAPDAYAVIDDGWKLIWNVVSRDERPEFELFDHEADPLNLSNLAEAHPDQVERLREILEAWRQSAGAAKVSDEGLAAELSQEELEELKALGYVQ